MNNFRKGDYVRFTIKGENKNGFIVGRRGYELYEIIVEEPLSDCCVPSDDIESLDMNIFDLLKERV